MPSRCLHMRVCIQRSRSDALLPACVPRNTVAFTVAPCGVTPSNTRLPAHSMPAMIAVLDSSCVHPFDRRRPTTGTPVGRGRRPTLGVSATCTVGPPGRCPASGGGATFKTCCAQTCRWRRCLTATSCRWARRRFDVYLVVWDGHRIVHAMLFNRTTRVVCRLCCRV